jgi:RNA polymerase sigma-70 factor (ECF subfamily)
MADTEQFMRNWIRAQPVVSAYINSLVPDFHAAEDRLQDVAVILLRKYADYDVSRPFVSWALGVARLEVLAARNDRTRSSLCAHPGIASVVADAYAELSPELEQRKEALRRCLEGVRGRPLDLLRLRYEASLPPREITGRVGMSAGAVRAMLCRTRAALQACIERRLASEGRSS